MNKIRVSSILNGALAALLLAGCVSSVTPALPTAPQLESPVASPGSTNTSEPVQTAEHPRVFFSSYNLEPVNGRPLLQQEAIDPRMGNVLVPLVLSAEQLNQLGKDGVISSPADYPEFHVLYKESVQNNLPVFVTSDALLHAYHLTFDQLLSSLEEYVFLTKLRELNQALLAQIEMEYGQLKDTSWGQPARGVYAYLAVGSRLADPSYQFPEVVKDLAQAELDLIEAAGGPAPSPIFPLLKYGEDYSQYIPRGHYTKSEALKDYFRAMMWYGRMTFRLNDPEDPQVGQDETRMALLLALAFRDENIGSIPVMEQWRILYDPTAFLVGRSDDLTVEDYLQVMDQVYGSQANLGEIADDARLQTFIATTDGLPAPRILGLLSDDYKPLEAVKGLRLMGQRFVPDAYIFQELIHPKVPNRFLPSGLDVMAVMGSERAKTWLTQDPTTQNTKYGDQFDDLAAWIGTLSQEDWIETSYNGWLYTLQPLLDAPGGGYPLFMQSNAWQDKQLNTALGSWVELKHDTLLYAKQAYGGLGGCGWPAPPIPILAQSYVEPVPEVFARIAALAEMTRQGLEERGLFKLIPSSEEYALTFGDRFDALASKALEFKSMAEKELLVRPLTEEEENSLRSFGDYMEDVVIWANGDKPELDPAAIIADVATDPNKGEVLEVGIGNVHEIYVVAPIPQSDGSLALTVARGGVFSYYEFPSQERLTDEAWREKVKQEEISAQPAFTHGFSVLQPASPDIQAVIYRFQRDWANWLYWTIGYNGTTGCPISPEFRVSVSQNVLGHAQDVIATLRSKSEYEGRQWISTDYLSIEPSASSPRNVIVTVRETWNDYLVTYLGSDPFAWYDTGQPEPITARRGPYTVDVSYELEPIENVCSPLSQGNCYTWRVIHFEELTGRPVWETP